MRRYYQLVGNLELFPQAVGKNDLDHGMQFFPQLVGKMEEPLFSIPWGRSIINVDFDLFDQFNLKHDISLLN